MIKFTKGTSMRSDRAPEKPAFEKIFQKGMTTIDPVTRTRMSSTRYGEPMNASISTSFHLVRQAIERSFFCPALFRRCLCTSCYHSVLPSGFCADRQEYCSRCCFTAANAAAGFGEKGITRMREGKRGCVGGSLIAHGRVMRGGDAWQARRAEVSGEISRDLRVRVCVRVRGEVFAMRRRRGTCGPASPLPIPSPARATARPTPRRRPRAWRKGAGWRGHAVASSMGRAGPAAGGAGQRTSRNRIRCRIEDVWPAPGIGG